MSLGEILLLGCDGQLGRSFVARFSEQAEKYLYHSVSENYYLGNDLMYALANKYSPQVIINAAAYTNVDLAEKEPEKALAVNFDGVAHLAELAKKYNLLLVHFSSDYVFDGSGALPWNEDDVPSPLNIYGKSKWLGEQAIIASGCRHLIIRTSWLHSPWRKNFIKTMLQLGHVNTELVVVSDQVGAPTSTAMLAEMALLATKQVVANPALAGIYHVTASGTVSWFEYARFIFNEAQRLGLISRVPDLIPVTSVDYPSLVSRPLNSRLNSTHFCQTFGVQLPDWREGVLDTLRLLQEDM